MIYLITVEGQNYCKIGYSSNIKRRLVSIQVSNPFRCNVKYVINGDKRHEKILHKKFSKYRIGGEWFVYNNEIDNFFSKYKDIEKLPYRIVLNIKEALKQNIFMGFDRVGQFGLMGYIGSTLNIDTMVWEFNKKCLTDNGLTLNTFNSYIKVLKKHNVVKKIRNNTYCVNENMFIYKIVNDYGK